MQKLVNSFLLFVSKFVYLGYSQRNFSRGRYRTVTLEATKGSMEATTGVARSAPSATQGYRLDTASPHMIRAPDLQIDAFRADSQCGIIHRDNGDVLEAVFVPSKRQVGIASVGHGAPVPEGEGRAQWITADSLQQGVEQLLPAWGKSQEKSLAGGSGVG